MNALARLIALLFALALAACGGSMEAGVGSGGSGAPLSTGIGSVSGFGSILMNGDRYDETSAQVFVDVRPDRPTPATVSAIRLGMHAELQHRNFVIATATVSAELVGPVSSVTGSALVALAQTVRVNADPARPTVFEGFTTLAELAGGAVVEVHGDRAPNGDILATRVELKPTALPLVRIAGTASNVGNGSFAIGGLTVSTASASIVPAGASLANGQRVIAWTDVPYTGGTLAAKVVRTVTTSIAGGATITLDGVIGDFQSPSSFRVGGLTVNAASASFTGGTATNLSNGTVVRVRGTSANNLVNATSVEFLQSAQAVVQLTGDVTDFADANSPFRIRESLARVTAQTAYVGGAASNLGTGVMVKLTGPLANGIVQATSVEFLPVGAGAQRVVFGQVGAPISPIAADGSRTFRVDALANDVKTTAATAYKNGFAADVAVGRQVKLKGSLQGSQFVADEVQFMDNQGSPPSVELQGIAGNVQPASLTVNGQTVLLTGSTGYTLNGVSTTAASLQNGLRVDVVCVRVTGVLTAVSVDIQAQASGAASVRGLVSGRTPADAAQFLVGSQRVDVSGNPKVLPASKSLADVVNGTDVDVQGTLANAILNATRIQIR